MNEHSSRDAQQPLISILCPGSISLQKELLQTRKKPGGEKMITKESSRKKRFNMVFSQVSNKTTYAVVCEVRLLACWGCAGQCWEKHQH